MTRQELNNGFWYLVKKKQDWMMGKFIHNIMLANGYQYLPETMEELGFEWIEIDPELIFHTFENNQVKQ